MKEKLGLIIKHKVKIAIALVMILSITGIFAITKLPDSSKSIGQNTGTRQAEHVTAVPTGYTGIYNATDLSNIRNNLSGNYILMNDIDASSIANFAPIGTDYTTQFTGVLDGNEYKISNLNIESTAQYVGLFGYINRGTVKNLEIENETIKGTGTLQTYIGGLVGFAYCATIEGVKITGASKIEDTNTNGNNIGGLVGYAISGKITQSSTNTQITKNVSSTKYSYVGGLVGEVYSDVTIKKSYSRVDINVTTAGNIGGLVGYIDNMSTSTLKSTITESYAIGNIQIGAKAKNTGGIVGIAKGKEENSTIPEITNVYTDVKITGVGNTLSYTGGVVGYGSYTNVTNTYAIGEIEVTEGKVGGIVGTVANIYARYNSNKFILGTRDSRINFIRYICKSNRANEKTSKLCWLGF